MNIETSTNRFMVITIFNQWEMKNPLIENQLKLTRNAHEHYYSIFVQSIISSALENVNQQQHYHYLAHRNL